MNFGTNFLYCILLSVILQVLSHKVLNNAHDPLLDAVNQASGVYLDASRIPNLTEYAKSHLNRTVIVTAFNYGYSNHLHNFKCLAERLNLKVLVISMDRHAHEVAEKLNNTIISYHWKDLSHMQKHTVKEEATKFRSEQFNLMSLIKLEAVLEILKIGFNVVFADPDIAIVRDPIPYVMWQGVDYVFSLNKICPQSYEWDFFKSEEEGNTGFYYVQSNARTIKLFQNVIQAAPKYPEYDDQSIFWIVLRGNKIPNISISPMNTCSHLKESNDKSNKLKICPLDGCMFCAGALRGVAYDWLRDNLKRKNLPLVTVHANYLKGGEVKAAALQKHGYWITDYPKSQICRHLNTKYQLQP